MSQEELLAKGRPPRPLPPATMYTAVCVDVVDLGMMERTYQGKPQGKSQRILIIFQLDGVDPDTGKRYEVAEGFWLTLSAKGALSRFLEQWRGKPFTDAERAGGWNVMKLIGACGLAQIQHESKDGTTYANIKPIVQLPKSMPWIEPLDYVRAKDRPAKDGGPGAPSPTAAAAEEPEERLPF